MIKIKRDSYKGKELATHQFPTFWQSVNGHPVDLFHDLEKIYSVGEFKSVHWNCCEVQLLASN